MFNLKHKYPIAIDIGSRNIYAAQLKESRHGFSLKALMHIKLDEGVTGNPDSDEILRDSFRRIYRNRQFSGKRAVVHLPAQNIYSYPIRFTIARTETLEEAILREARNVIPFALEDAVLDYPSVDQEPGENKNAARAILVAVRRSFLEQYLAILKKAGLLVEAVDFNTSSLMRLHNHIHELGSSPAILCAIGYTSSLLAIVKKDSILAQRNIPWSIGLSLQKIMTNLGPLDHEDKAKALLKSYGLIYDDRQRADQDREVNEDTSLDTRPRTLYQILTPDIDELIHEFHELIGYVRSGEPSLVFDKIYLYGQAALIRHLSEYIERRINIPAEIIDPLSHEAFSGYTMPPEISESSPFALALGLAMRKVTWL